MSNNFYNELDQEANQKSHRAGCTCQTMASIFLITLALCGFLIWKIVHKISIDNIAGYEWLKKDSATSEGKSLFEQGEKQIIITEDELNSLLASAQEANPNFPIKSKEVKITSEHIFLKGEIKEPIKFDGEIYLKPEAKNGRLDIKIIKVNIGQVSIPSFLLAAIEDEIQKTIEQEIGEMEVKKIELGDGRMEIK